jgi:two-component system, chemotaxis family, protein-glutamate methylesterase/glutaminase
MIRVMIVDDSALVRKIASDILGSDPEITVVATAAQAEFALLKLEKEQPDVITLDLEMPGMGGLDAIRRIMMIRPTPIVVMSAHAAEGAEQTLRALDLGAMDFVLKPSGSLSGGIAAVSRELIDKVKNASRVKLQPVNGTTAVSQARPFSSPANYLEGFAGKYQLVAIGTSTGGPVALKTVLTGLPADLPAGIVVVQHMPPVFTRAFAERLDSCCTLKVKEAEGGDAILPGRVLIAPGNLHMTVSKIGGVQHVLLDESEHINGHRPSVDRLMFSVAGEYGDEAIGVIMTGMGRDGVEGLRELRRRGGLVIAQDRDTSVIYGMNREVIQNGDADEVVPVEAIAGRIAETLRCRALSREAK